jgi:hypothetical protein
VQRGAYALAQALELVARQQHYGERLAWARGEGVQQQPQVLRPEGVARA